MIFKILDPRTIQLNFNHARLSRDKSSQCREFKALCYTCQKKHKLNTLNFHCGFIVECMIYKIRLQFLLLFRNRSSVRYCLFLFLGHNSYTKIPISISIICIHIKQHQDHQPYHQHCQQASPHQYSQHCLICISMLIFYFFQNY